MKKKVFFLKIILFSFLFVAVERFCHKQTRGFSLQKIASEAPLVQDESFSREPDASVHAILDQPFTFLASGGQCYAFISEDKQTILKFFKQHHIRDWNRINAMTLPQFLEPYRKRFLERKTYQSPLLVESCKIAQSEFQDRTGLLYLHLHKTHYFHKKLKIIDPLGIAHFIDLDTTDFTLQRTADLTHPRFRDLIQKNQLDTAKQCIDSMIALITERCAKGIHDRDPNIRRNFGFLGTQAIEIDLGSFTRDERLKEPEVYKMELVQRMTIFHHWLKKENPELALYLSEKVKEITGTSL